MAYFGPTPQTIQSGSLDSLKNLSDLSSIPTARGNLGFDLLGGYRNKIINGDFDIWQRGTSQSTSGYGSADRWYFAIGSGATASVSRQTFTLGQTDVPGNPEYFARITRTVTGSTSTGFENPIEDVKTLSGRKATITFYAKVGVAGDIHLNVAQFFGTGGSPSSVVSMTTVVLSATTSWQKFTQTVDIPSISGKTLGTNNNDYLGIKVNMPTTLGNTTLDIAHFSIVDGDATSEADPFSPRHLGQELALCYRYYWRNNPGNGKSITSLQCYSTSAAIGGAVYFPVEMRTVPTVSSFAAGEFSLITATGSTVGVNAMTVGYATTKSLGFPDVAAVSASLVAGNATSLITSGTSAAIIADAEL